MTPLHPDGTSNLWVSWLAGMVACAITSEAAWPRHTVDASLQGADGVRLGDANRDGLPDITTAWEESGIIRVYLNAGLSQITQHWPMITVGKVSSPALSETRLHKISHRTLNRLLIFDRHYITCDGMI